jgi:hypothetical protein
MAKLLTDDLTYVHYPITKFEEDADGNLVVEGVVTDGTVDSDRQIVEPGFSAKALTDWMESGPNVRVMHSPSLYPAGRGLQVELGENTHRLKALVVEPTAQKLVRNKVLRAFSVGIANPVITRDPSGRAPGGIVTGGELAEVSLVDRPANKNCQLVLAKSADLDVPWTYGDLDALLTKAEGGEAVAEPDLTKDDDKAPKPEGLVDPSDPGDPDDQSGPDSSADVDDRDDATHKAYQQAVTLHKAAEPGRDGVALSGTEYLRKVGAWQRWAQDGEDAGLDGTPAGFALWLGKRDFDPAVGGGVDRDTMPAADFVDPSGRRFPIHAPGDVSDAVSSYGRADPQIPMPLFRDRLTEIAHRKGPAFVAQLPGSWPAANKDITLTSPDPDGMAPFNLQGQDDAAALKGGGKTCPGCGKTYHADAKVRRCEDCGRKLPKGDTATKVRRPMPADVAEAGPHREPDGSVVEAYEADAGLDDDDMGADEDDVPDSTLKGADGGAAYVVKRTHDALCAAYDWADVTDTYPALSSVADATDVDWWTAQAGDALDKGDMAGVAFLAAAAHSADELAAAEYPILADARAGLHKAFAAMHPMANPHPAGAVTPGMFQRPYLSAGHATASAGGGVQAVPPASHTINPDMFDRDLITAGHEAQSPGDRGDNAPAASVRSGAARHFYTNAARTAAETAMRAMHDHIASTFPDMCPMAASKYVMPTDMHDTARPTRVVPGGGGVAPGEKAYDPDLVKAVKAARKAARKAEQAAARATLTKTETTVPVVDYEATIAAMQRQLDELGAQPDPAQAPLRGVVKAAVADTPVPVDKRSLAAEAQALAEAETAAQYVQYLRGLTKSATPALREQAEERLGDAEAALRGMLTKLS